MITLLFSPTVLLLAGLLGVLVLAWRKRQRGIAGLAALLAAALYVFTTPLPVHVLAHLWSVTDSPACAQPPSGATVVVLTGGATGSARSASEVWRLDQASFRRIIHALALARRTPDSEILVSGGAESGLTNEARLAEQLLLQMGWPATRLRVEDTSLDTFTSARDVAPLLQAGRPLLLVTSAFHMRRAAYVYRRAGMQPVPCSAPDPDALVVPDSLLPEAGTLSKSSQLWKEMLGLIVYSMRKVPGDGTG